MVLHKGINNQITRLQCIFCVEFNISLSIIPAVTAVRCSNKHTAARFRQMWLKSELQYVQLLYVSDNIPLNMEFGALRGKR